MKKRAALFLTLLFTARCSTAGEATSIDPSCDPAAAATLHPAANAAANAASVQPILMSSCALGGCHIGTEAAGDLDLTPSSNRWRDNVVGRPSHENPRLLLVDAGNPDRSWLMQKLTGQFCTAGSACDPHLGCGQRMPFGQALSVDDMTTIFVWIRAGAPP